MEFLIFISMFMPIVATCALGYTLETKYKVSSPPVYYFIGAIGTVGTMIILEHVVLK